MLNDFLISVGSATVSYAPALLAGAFVTQLLYNWLGYNLRSFPGPTLAPFTDAWRVWNTWYKKDEKPFIELHKKYGDVVRMGPNVLSFSRAETITDIYGTRQNYEKVFRQLSFPFAIYKEC